MSIIKYQKPDTLHILGQLKTVYCHTLVLNIQNKLCPFILYVLIVIHKFKYFLKMYLITKVVYHQFYWLSFFKYNIIYRQLPYSWTISLQNFSIIDKRTENHLNILFFDIWSYRPKLGHTILVFLARVLFETTLFRKQFI